MMVCGYHLERPAAMVCEQCGRGLCIDCAYACDPPGYCYDCLLIRNRKRRNSLISTLVKGLVVATAVAAVMASVYGTVHGTLLSITVGFYLGLSLYWGRRTVRRLTRGLGGLAVLGGAAASTTPLLPVIAGVLFGLVVWAGVGIVSWPLEVGYAIFRLGRLHRASAGIRAGMPHPVLVQS
jgi:ABC-type amino acid transport system permease subunit